jgi:AcrR family transcriptional regulator
MTPSRAATRPRLERLLVDLEHLFLEEGFLHFRTEELARRFRCSKRALYELAPSRQELFERVVERWLSALRRAGEEAARSAPDPFVAITAYLGAAVTATRAAGAQFVRDLSRFPPTHRRLMSHQRKRIAGLERLIEAGTARGDFRGVHSKLVAEVMLHAVARLVDPDVLATLGLTMSEAFAELYDIVEHGLLPHASEGRVRKRGRLKSTGRGDRQRKWSSSARSAARAV